MPRPIDDRPAVRDDLRGRRYAACVCSPDTPCVACPLAHPCSCGAAPGRPCTRPSGHRGPLIALHTERVLHSDVDAIVRDAAAVEARLLADRDNPTTDENGCVRYAACSATRTAGTAASTPR